MRRRGGVSAWLSLAVYLAAALVSPELHRRHHARFGADHVHGPLGTIYFTALRDEPTVFDHHAAFDADLAALDLADVALAGALTVDCSLAEFTAVDCSGARPDHAHNFGDELFARHHHHKAPDLDPTHGAGSLEHLGASLVTAAPFVLAPPSAADVCVVAAARPTAPALPPRRRCSSRAPPAAA